VALVATGVALAAPAGAVVLKPGVPTAVKAVPTSKGTATLTWKAPVVKKGKSAKATSYTVVCTGAKKVTVKTTKATVTILKVGFKDNVSCLVTAVAGKAVGKAAKSNAFTAYKTLATARFTLVGAAATSLGSKLGVKAPATFNKAKLTITLPVVNILKDANPAANDDDLILAGALIVAGVPMPNIKIVPDAAFNSTDVPSYDLIGKTSIGTIPVLTLKHIVVNPTTGVDTFDVYLTSNPQVVQLLKALGITAAAGELLGTGSIG
jgi:hypothetical protein